MRKAEEAEQRALRRFTQIKNAEEKELLLRWQKQSGFWKNRDFDIELEVVAARSRSQDPVWKSHVADNQWFMQKAVMYGTAANQELLTQLLQAILTRPQIPRQVVRGDG